MTGRAIQPSRLDELETVIAEGMRTFVDVGAALAEVRDNKLYSTEAGYKTFEAYCKDRWGWGRSYAHRLIDAAATAENVANCQQMPVSEGQVRPLTKLPPEKQPEAWDTAIEKAVEELGPGAKPTHKHVQRAVDQVIHLEPSHPAMGLGLVAATNLRRSMTSKADEIRSHAHGLNRLRKTLPEGQIESTVHAIVRNLRNLAKRLEEYDV